MALHSKKKLGFIDGTILIPKNDLDREKECWEINALVNSWMLNAIKPSLQSSLNYSERAHELWTYSKDMFLVGNGPRKLKLKVALANCKRGGNSINAYYSQLRKL